MLLFLFLVLQVVIVTSFTQLRDKQDKNIAHPNLYDPIYEVGEITVDEGSYCINNFKIRIWKSQYDFSDYNEDGIFLNIWDELWHLQGKKVLVEGHRGRNVEAYDQVFITTIKLIKE